MSFHSPSGNWVFIHVPKTGGSSIRDMLRDAFPDADYLSLAHDGPEEVRAVMGEARWSEAFKFAFVRNPYTWVESMRRYALRQPGSRLYDFAGEDNAVGFVEELYRACDDEYLTPNGRLRFQRRLVEGLDAVFRFETFPASVGLLSYAIKADLPIQHKNRNGQPAIPIRGEYRAAIARWFRADFEKLQYPR